MLIDAWAYQVADTCMMMDPNQLTIQRMREDYGSRSVFSLCMCVSVTTSFYYTYLAYTCMSKTRYRYTMTFTTHALCGFR